ncbi:MAG: hypothetical protein M0Z42_26620 [Actinomycetota bacterium]|nr:hypothetical protein [Actinomycetota bacterium]
MPGEGDIVVKRVTELVHGDATLEYGVVTHREGRKVWFENRVVTFNSVDDELQVDTSSTEG